MNSKFDTRNDVFKILQVLITLTATSTKEENEWKAEMEALRKQLAERSSVCGFLKEQTESTRCGHSLTGITFSEQFTLVL